MRLIVVVGPGLAASLSVFAATGAAADGAEAGGATTVAAVSGAAAAGFAGVALGGFFAMAVPHVIRLST
jgi:hypothetical protein